MSRFRQKSIAVWCDFCRRNQCWVSHTPALLLGSPVLLGRGCSVQISEQNRCKMELRFRLLRAMFDEFFRLPSSLVAWGSLRRGCSILDTEFCSSWTVSFSPDHDGFSDRTPIPAENDPILQR